MTSKKHVSTLRFDPKNARKRTERGTSMLIRSMEEVGFARSLVIDENNVVLCGNGSLEAAGQIGLENVIVVDADGETIVAVRRSGLTEEQKLKLALYDNRTSDLSDFDPVVLSELNQEIDLSGLWTDDEMDTLLEMSGGEDDEEYDRGNGGRGKKEVNCVCPNCGHEFVKQL